MKNWLNEIIWKHLYSLSVYLKLFLNILNLWNVYVYTFTCIDIGNESKVPCGVIEIMMELFPKSTKNFGQDVVAAQISLEKSRQAERERLFLVYAKQWWKEYLQIRPAHQDRLVKIFAQVKWSNLLDIYSNVRICGSNMLLLYILFLFSWTILCIHYLVSTFHLWKVLIQVYVSILILH